MSSFDPVRSTLHLRSLTTLRLSRHCAEWYIDVGTKSYRFFSDASEVQQIGFTGKNDSQMSNYSSIIVGAEFYQMPPAPFVMWFDDLALDDNQIGCQ